MKIILLFVLFVLFVLFAAYYFGKFNVKEGWVDYIQKPYKYVREGSDPIHYYRRDRYRKPYRHGFTFNQTYPYQHKEPLS